MTSVNNQPASSIAGSAVGRGNSGECGWSGRRRRHRSGSGTVECTRRATVRLTPAGQTDWWSSAVCCVCVSSRCALCPCLVCAVLWWPFTFHPSVAPCSTPTWKVKFLCECVCVCATLSSPPLRSLPVCVSVLSPSVVRIFDPSLA